MDKKPRKRFVSLVSVRKRGASCSLTFWKLLIGARALPSPSHSLGWRGGGLGGLPVAALTLPENPGCLKARASERWVPCSGLTSQTVPPERTAFTPGGGAEFAPGGLWRSEVHSMPVPIEMLMGRRRIEITRANVFLCTWCYAKCFYSHYLIL